MRPPCGRSAVLLLLLRCSSGGALSGGNLYRGAPASKPPRGPKAKQSLGQNFLVDASIAQRIASSVIGDESEGGSRVVELWPSSCTPSPLVHEGADLAGRDRAP